MADITGTLASGNSIKGNLGVVYGKDGKSAYEIALANGFEGTEKEWLASLKGADGTMSFEELTEEQKESLRGEQGEQGEPFTYEDFTQEQLEALKGEPGYTPVKGVDYFDGKDGTMSFEDLTEEQKATLKGDKGDDGVTPSVSFRYNATTGDLYYEVSDTEVLDEAVF